MAETDDARPDDTRPDDTRLVLPQRPPRRQRSRRARTVAWVVAAVLLVVAAVAAFTAWQALQARDELMAAQPLVPRIQDELTGGDPAAAQATLADLQDHTSRAADLTSGPHWALVARLPWVGDDVHAVREVADVTDDVAQDALPAVVAAANGATPEALAPRDGAVDLAPLQAAREPLARAEQAMTAADERVAGIDTSGVVEQVAEPVARLKHQLSDAASTTRTASRLATLLPPMLGADGPRSYLVLFQNNAEVRATGGMPGAIAVVTAEAGRVELVEHATAASIGRFDQPVLPLDDLSLEVQGDRQGVYFADIGFSPDFPTAAILGREMWRRHTGQHVDGVVAVDPAALSYILRGTGPVTLDRGEQINTDNAVDLLLFGAYERFTDTSDQDEFFAVAAAAAFSQVTAGAQEPRLLIDGLSRAVDERRLLVWSAVEREQDVIALTGVSGQLPSGEPGAQTLGVFLNDGTGAKMDTFLRQDLHVQGVCDARETHRVRLRLRSTAPADAAASLPAAVTGPGTYGVPKGVVRTQVLMYAPVDSGFTQAARDGSRVSIATEEHLGRQVSMFTVDLAPGEESTIEVDLAGAGPQELDVLTSPLALPEHTSVASVGCGSS